jgi:2,5-diketo-D-gluconate reductase A
MDTLISTDTLTVPTIRLNDGRHIPRIGFGVWQIENDAVTAAVSTALETGYRLVDTAQGYNNEEGVGQALQGRTVPRDSVFVTTKLRTKAMGRDGAINGVRESLKALGLDYIDMMLIHWPTPAHDQYADTWRGLVEAQKDGLVRSIGVSNFLVEHVERIISETGVFPAVNQLETHPYFQQRGARQFHERHGIRLESYSPLGHGEALKDPAIETIANRHSKSPAQIVIRWHYQQDLIVIPKSATADRIRENLDVLDFELSTEDMARIDALDQLEGRTGSDPATFNDLY